MLLGEDKIANLPPSSKFGMGELERGAIGWSGFSVTTDGCLTSSAELGDRLEFGAMLPDSLFNHPSCHGLESKGNGAHGRPILRTLELIYSSLISGQSGVP
jgi:hypothetical protein